MQGSAQRQCIILDVTCIVIREHRYKGPTLYNSHILGIIPLARQSLSVVCLHCRHLANEHAWYSFGIILHGHSECQEPVSLLGEKTDAIRA